MSRVYLHGKLSQRLLKYYFKKNCDCVDGTKFVHDDSLVSLYLRREMASDVNKRFITKRIKAKPNL